MIYLIVLIRDYIQYYNRLLTKKKKKKEDIFLRLKNIFIYFIQLKWYYIYTLLPNELVGFKSVNFFITNPSFFIIYAYNSKFLRDYFSHRNLEIISNQNLSLLSRHQYGLKVIIKDFRNNISLNNLLQVNNKLVIPSVSLLYKGVITFLFSIISINPYFIYCIKKLYYDGFVTLAPSFIGYIFGHLIYLISFKYVPQIFIFIYSWERVNILFGFCLTIYLGFLLFLENSVLVYNTMMRFGLELELNPTVKVEYEPRGDRILYYDKFSKFIFPLFRQLFKLKTYFTGSFYLGLLCALFDQPRFYSLLSNYVPSLSPTLLEYLVESNNSHYILFGYLFGYFFLLFVTIYIFYWFRHFMIYIANVNFAEIIRRIKRNIVTDKDTFDILNYKNLSLEDKKLYNDRKFPENDLGLYGKKLRYILASIIYTMGFSILMYYPFGFFTLGSLGFVSHDTALYGTVFDPYTLDEPSKVFSLLVTGHETGTFKISAMDRGRYGQHPAFSIEAPFVPETFRFRPEMIKYRLINFLDFYERSVASVPYYTKYLPIRTAKDALTFKQTADQQLVHILGDKNKDRKKTKFRQMSDFAKDLLKYGKSSYQLKGKLKKRRIVERKRNILQRNFKRGIGRTFKKTIIAFGSHLPFLKDIVCAGCVYQDQYALFKANIDRFYNWYMQPFNRVHVTPFMAFSTANYYHMLRLPAKMRPIEEVRRVTSIDELKSSAIVVRDSPQISGRYGFSFILRDCENIEDSRRIYFYKKLGFYKVFKLLDLTKFRFYNRYKNNKKYYKKRLYDFRLSKSIVLPTSFYRFNVYNANTTVNNVFKSTLLPPEDLKIYNQYKKTFFPNYDKNIEMSSESYNNFVQKGNIDLLSNFKYELFDRMEKKKFEKHFNFFDNSNFRKFYTKANRHNAMPIFSYEVQKSLPKNILAETAFRKMKSVISWAKRDPLVDELRGKSVRDLQKGKVYSEKSVKDAMGRMLRFYRTKSKIILEFEVISQTVFVKDRFLMFLRRYAKTYCYPLKIMFNIVYSNPFIKNISPNQEVDLHYKKLYYLQFLNSLRKYKYDIYSEVNKNYPFKSVFFKNSCKSFSNKFHNQQFKGTIKRVRRHFSCTQEGKYRVRKRLMGDFFNTIKFDNLYFNDNISLQYHPELDYNRYNDFNNKMLIDYRLLLKYKDPTAIYLKKNVSDLNDTSNNLNTINCLKDSKVSPFIEKLNYHPLALLTNKKTGFSYLGQQDLTDYTLIREGFTNTLQPKDKYCNEDPFGVLYEHKTRAVDIFKEFRSRRLPFIVTIRSMKSLYKNWPLSREKIDKFFLSFRSFKSKSLWFNSLDSVRKSLYWEPATLQLNAFVHSSELFNFRFARLEKYVQQRLVNYMEAHNMYALLNEMCFQDSPHWMKKWENQKATAQEDSLFTYLSYKARLRRFMPSFLRNQSFYRVYDRGLSDRMKQSIATSTYYYVNKPTLGGYYWKGSDLTVTFYIIFRNFLLYLISIIFFFKYINYKTFQFPYTLKKYQADYINYIKKKQSISEKKNKKRLKNMLDVSINKWEFPSNKYIKIHKKLFKQSDKDLIGLQWRIKDNLVESKKLLKKQKSKKLKTITSKKK